MLTFKPPRLSVWRVLPQSAVPVQPLELLSSLSFCLTEAFSLHQKEEVTDWRKNVEAMSGMEGRKKLFNAGQ